MSLTSEVTSDLGTEATLNQNLYEIHLMSSNSCQEAAYSGPVTPAFSHCEVIYGEEQNR